MRGFYGIGIENAKHETNVGTLWRSAYNLGASFIFTLGNRIRKQASDTPKAWMSIPYYRYDDVDQLIRNLPYDCRLVGVEFPHEEARPIQRYAHPDRCAYLLGAEDNGLRRDTIEKCHDLIYIPSRVCMNVSAAGSIVMYGRACLHGFPTSNAGGLQNVRNPA